MCCPRVLHFRKARAKSKASSLDIKSLPTSSELEPMSFQPESALPIESQPEVESIVEETEEKAESESQ